MGSQQSLSPLQVAREVREEAGVDVESVHILGSQPWPIGEAEAHSLLRHAVSTQHCTPTAALCQPWLPQTVLRAMFWHTSLKPCIQFGQVTMLLLHIGHLVDLDACRPGRLLRADDRVHGKGEERCPAYG